MKAILKTLAAMALLAMAFGCNKHEPDKKNPPKSSDVYFFGHVHDGKKISMDAGLANPNSWGINGSYLSGK